MRGPLGEMTWNDPVGKIYRFNRLRLKAIFRGNGLKTGLEQV